jgi:predicted nucleotidyltransferase
MPASGSLIRKIRAQPAIPKESRPAPPEWPALPVVSGNRQPDITYQYIGHSTNILVDSSPMKTPSNPSLLEEVLGARSKVAVLRTLFNSKLGHSGGAIARQTGVGLYAVQKTLATLEGIGLVDVERGPVENRYRLNTQHYIVTNGLSLLFEGERRMPQALARELGALLKGKVVSAGLFGSFPRGAARAGSDIDLFVVVQTLEEKEQMSHILTDAQAELTRRYGWPVQAVIFELHRLARAHSKGQSLLEEAAANWQHVTGQPPDELLEKLNPKRATGQRW